MIDTFQYNTKAITIAWLHITRYIVIIYLHAIRYIHVTTRYSSAVNSYTSYIPHLGSYRVGSANSIITYHNTACPTGGTRSVWIFDLHSKTAIVGNRIARYHIHPGTLKAYGRHTIISIVVYIVIIHRYTTGTAILQLDTATVIAIYMIVTDVDILFQTIPDNNTPGANGMAFGSNMGNAYSGNRAIGIEATAAYVI